MAELCCDNYNILQECGQQKQLTLIHWVCNRHTLCTNNSLQEGFLHSYCNVLFKDFKTQTDEYIKHKQMINYTSSEQQFCLTENFDITNTTSINALQSSKFLHAEINS